MNTIDLGKKLLEWNKKNLVKDSALTKNKIAELFADTFKVNANGRTYHANYDNYLAFLNQFRATIESIHYDCHDFIADEKHVVIPMTARIVRIDKTQDTFEAILILQFNQEEKIILWHEVYVKY